MERIKGGAEAGRSDRPRDSRSPRRRDGGASKADPRSRRVNRSTRAAEFAAFADDVHRDLNPRGPLERLIVDHVAQSAWRLKATLARQLDRDLGSDPDADALPASAPPVRVATTTTAAERAARSVREACETLVAVRARPVVGAATRPFRLAPPVVDRPEVEPNEWPIVPSGPLDEGLPADAEVASAPAAWRDRLVYDFDVSDISPVVKGTWITVGHVVSLIVDGSTWADILRSHPELTEDDIRICMAYAVAEDGQVG